ncbi:MAG: adenylate/guanylate cyclase domain-containing protein [Candidatus Hydrogenedentes bacterium]|nr:adenylate/guanylate cyclase domain-containing protein [Candidatus Hydrogenedentota bacterium]
MVNAADILDAKILIVDDQEANVLLLERTLRGAGYTSIASTMASCEVCDLHRKNSYDLILLDLQMPGMDGFEVMEGLKEIEAGGYLPVLVVTAQPGHKLRALQSGAKDFVSKPFDLVEVLARVHNMLEVRLLHLKTKLLYARVVAEQKVSERLLLNVLPHSIAERLKGRPEVVADSFAEVIADSFPEVTVLFADIVGFTKFSTGVSPEQLVVLLNEIFNDFDTIADNRGLEKIKSIGDAYMAAAGLPVPVDDHAALAAHMALDMLDALARFNERSGYNLQIRIGINSGPVVAGVIGKRKFIYDMWGAAVNIASRMESHGIAGRVQITGATRSRLGEPFLFEERGAIDVKDIGELRTYFLTGRTTMKR